MKRKERLEAAWRKREERWDRNEFIVQIILFVLALFLLIRIELLTEIDLNDIQYYEAGVRYALPPPEVQ